VGLAQIRKLDQILAIQRRNNHLLRSYLQQVPGISFRVIPDPEGDNASFLSWMLPTEAQTRAAIAEMKEAGIMAGNFYWYDNNWHYIRKWDHLKYAATLNTINPLQAEALQKLATTNFSASDAIMSRCISTAISLLWTEEQIREKGEKMMAALHKAVAAVPA
jgi:8-amino-3,8-dideoxy-alpha-D-manno-octulosonate transaminase